MEKERERNGLRIWVQREYIQNDLELLELNDDHLFLFCKYRFEQCDMCKSKMRHQHKKKFVLVFCICLYRMHLFNVLRRVV